MTTYKEANKENMNRWKKEPKEFAKMLPDFNTLKLKRIDILGDRNDHEHDGLDEDKKYLVCDGGNWHLASASNYNDTWNLWIGTHSIHLRNADIVFEITNLPEVEKHPLGRVKQDECEEVGTGECYYTCRHSMDCKFLDKHEKGR